MSDRVGIVGMGLMGQAFTHHLLQSGFKVQGLADRDRSALAAVLRGMAGLPKRT